MVPFRLYAHQKHFDADILTYQKWSLSLRHNCRRAHPEHTRPHSSRAAGTAVRALPASALQRRQLTSAMWHAAWLRVLSARERASWPEPSWFCVAYASDVRKAARAELLKASLSPSSLPVPVGSSLQHPSMLPGAGEQHARRARRARAAPISACKHCVALRRQRREVPSTSPHR